MKTAFRTLLFAGTLFIAMSCGNKKTDQTAKTSESSISKVSIQAASYRDVPQVDTYSSSVEAYAINNIAPQGSSRIQKIFVEVGDFVRAGQVVARMDEVQLKQSRLTMRNDSTELSRIKKLYDQGGVSKSDLDAIELAYNVARSQYNNILENTILRSPVSGVITARNYDRGDMFTMGKPIYVVEQITPVKLLVGISETDYTKVRKGETVTISADALPGKEFTGRINRIYPTMDSGTHTFTTEVIVPNANRLLRPGMYAKVNVTFSSNHSITVPDNCIVKQQGSGVKMVFLMNGDKTVKSVVVTVGRHIDDQYEILTGLEEGDNVVVKGQSSLKDGDKVQVSDN
jgi:RND family efflux transporter MFP subunit